MKILGYDYRIAITDTDQPGEMDPQSMQIILSANYHDTMIESAALHEIIEAINYHLHLGMKEAQVMGLEAGLFGVLREIGYDTSRLLGESPE